MRTCAGLCLCEHQTNSMENTGSDRSDAALETREIGVAGMTCDHCARRIENALRGGARSQDRARGSPGCAGNGDV
jgi:hypothetical protein